MQIANCLVALGGDQGNRVPKHGVTAAEIAVLRLEHGEDAVQDIEPAGEINRRNRDELLRLQSVYGRRDAQRASPVAILYPGAAARVHERLDELDLPEQFFKAERRAGPNSAPTPAAEGSSKVAGSTAEVDDDDGIEDMEPRGVLD
jgi:hypothetical protein